MMRGRTRPPRRGGNPKPARYEPPAPRLAEVTIEVLGGRGDGVARLGESPLFLPLTVPGDRVLARVESRRGDGLAGTAIEVLSPGPARVDPACRHFGACGGCTMQHVETGAYRAWKREILVTALARRGIAADAVGPLLNVPPGNRRRAAFSFLRRGSKALLGFNARSSHRIVELEECLLLDPALAGALPDLRRLLEAVVPEGRGGDLVVTLAGGGLDVLIAAEGEPDLFQREALAAFAAEHDLTRLSWRRAGGFAEPVAARRPAVVAFAGVAVEPPPGAFLQPSLQGERILADLVTAACEGRDPVLDLYAGCGTFTFPLALAGAAVHAVEGDSAAVAALKAAADRHRLRVTAEARDLARRPLPPAALARFAAVVFDPPRTGAAAQARLIAEGGPPVVVAVSCDAATFAHDAHLLMAGGYRLDRATPIDQFPWSPHLETVAVFRR